MSRAPERRTLRALGPRWLAAAGALLLLAGWVRVRNALRYPPDWGYDATFNWQYIRALSRDLRLPPPDAGWATADPPFFFYLAGLLWRGLEALGQRDQVLLAVPLANSAAGLAIAALAAVLVRRLDPGRPGRALLAAGLVLYQPCHVQMSLMVNEEVWTALFSSCALLALCSRDPTGAPRAELWRAARAGAAGGLALLSKLTGATAIAAGALTHALDGLRRAAPPGAVARRGLALLVAAGLVGGWFYARNRSVYGYWQPFGLAAHQRMFELPPGERGLGDYGRVPLATFLDPQLLHPDLLRSVWGSTYVSVWFDGHRYLLPRQHDGVRRLGTLTLLLALLPTAAFAAGLLRGAGRAWRGGTADVPLLALVGLVLGGYALFSWRNPWYAVLKGTSLLSLCLPFAWYASDELLRWAGRGRAAACSIGLALAALAACVVLGTSFDLLFEKTEVSGLPLSAAPATDASDASGRAP